MLNRVINEEILPSPSRSLKLSIITYWSGKYKVKGYLLEPKKRGNYPGILYLRGGIRQVGMVRVSRITQYAMEGFVVFAPFYRGNLGGEGEEDFGGEDREDALEAYEVLSTRTNVLKHRIHVVGFSRGGIMAAIVAKEKNPASMVSWGGVSDAVLTYKERPDLRKMLRRVSGGTPSENLQPYLDRSPKTMVDEINCPVLIVHGEKDTSVGIEHAQYMADALRRAGKQVECWYFQEYGHLLTSRDQLRVTKKVAGWLHNRKAEGAV